MGANAQTSVPTFTAGDVLTAANMNISAATGVPVFATTTTRDAAFGGTGEKTLAEGQMCYIEAAPKRLQVYNGTAWIDFDAEFTTFTPTFSAGYTRGNGTSSSSYCRYGKNVFVYVSETLGSTSSVSGAPRLDLPFAAAAITRVLGTFSLRDPGVVAYGGLVDAAASSNYVDGYVGLVNGTYLGFQTPNATVPFTWAANDAFYFALSYQAA